MVDLEFAYSINRPVIHTSVHQPVDDKLPGLSLAIFGQYFNRHETWAEMARPWVDYIAQQLLLQQGRNLRTSRISTGGSTDHRALRDGAASRRAAPLRRLRERGRAAQSRDRRRSESRGHERAARYRVLYLGGTSKRMTLPAPPDRCDAPARGRRSSEARPKALEPEGRQRPNSTRWCAGFGPVRR
jgi:hypothetical protein